MRALGVIGVCAALATASACTRRNEAKYCAEGTCTTPAYPFCDVTGEFSGEAGTCIAVTCTAGEFGECRDDYEVRCNPTGSNYDVVQCERGCDASADGCRLCDPGETACTNGKVATCDSSGTVIASHPCPLGCYEDQPRCRDIQPSNGLAAYLDMVTDPPDLDLSGGGTIVTWTGEIMNAASAPVIVPHFDVPAVAGGSIIRVFVARRVRLGDVRVSAGTSDFSLAPALAIVAAEDITVEGTVELTDYDRPAPGGVNFAGCKGGPGQDITGTQTMLGGAGGGGHATAGARGGGVEFMAGGGQAGAASGTETLEPLRGGCTSMDVVTGGGALQLSSRTRVQVSGVINVNGGAGGQQIDTVVGGGAGGGILIEAPVVELAASAKLLANGGPGAAHEMGGTASTTLAAAMGGKCSATNQYCAPGGNGAAVGVAATNGGLAPYTNDSSVTLITGGGGGGGLGRLRINTRDGSYTKTSTAIEAAVTSTGVLKTR